MIELKTLLAKMINAISEKANTTGGVFTGDIAVNKSGAASRMQVWSRDSSDNSTISSGQLVAFQGGTFGVYDIRHQKWLIHSDSNGNILIGNRNPGNTIVYSATINAHATQNTYAEATINALANWNVVSVRCRVLNTTQQLLFARGSSGESYLTYTDANGKMSRGGFWIDWTNNKLKVRWTHGSENTNIYAESVVGIL